REQRLGRQRLGMDTRLARYRVVRRRWRYMRRLRAGEFWYPPNLARGRLLLRSRDPACRHTKRRTSHDCVRRHRLSVRLRRKLTPQKRKLVVTPKMKTPSVVFFFLLFRSSRAFFPGFFKPSGASGVPVMKPSWPPAWAPMRNHSLGA